MTALTEAECRKLVERLSTLSAMIQMGERIAWGSDSKLMAEAATAIESLLAERGRAIKALKWEVNVLTWQETWEAETSIGRYSITETIEPRCEPPVQYDVYLNDGGYVGPKTTLGEAQAAAQSDYETRIRSALGAFRVDDIPHIRVLMAERDRMGKALLRISGMCPATADMSVAHMMADEADAALQKDSTNAE